MTNKWDQSNTIGCDIEGAEEFVSDKLAAWQAAQESKFFDLVTEEPKEIDTIATPSSFDAELGAYQN